MSKIKLKKIVGNLLDKFRKKFALMERSSRNFSRPQPIENSRQYFLLRKDILQKTVVGCPCVFTYFCYNCASSLDST